MTHFLKFLGALFGFTILSLFGSIGELITVIIMLVILWKVTE